MAKTAERLHPKIAVRKKSPNYSSRGGVKPRLIVVHSTEGSNIPGTADLVGLGNWFAQSSAQASSHVGTDADGQSARFVDDGNKSWACAGFNSVSLNIEQVGKAATEHWTAAEVTETARWCAKWCLKYDIPVQEGAVSGSTVTKAGIIRHSQLGSYGGGHSDPGSAYPFALLLRETARIVKELKAKKK